jgi:hypothetical protein
VGERGHDHRGKRQRQQRRRAQRREHDPRRLGPGIGCSAAWEALRRIGSSSSSVHSTRKSDIMLVTRAKLVKESVPSQAGQRVAALQPPAAQTRIVPKPEFG